MYIRMYICMFAFLQPFVGCLCYLLKEDMTQSKVSITALCVYIYIVDRLSVGMALTHP